MTKKEIKKSFLVFGTVLFASSFMSCSIVLESPPASYLHIDFFYNIENRFLIDNKVIIGMGNCMFDENNNRIFFDENNTYKRIKNISLVVFVDNDINSVQKIEIVNVELFSSEYKVMIQKNIFGQSKYLRPEDYSKTFKYQINNYDIDEYIKFVISYDEIRHESKHVFYRSVSLYGKFMDSNFYIYDIGSQ